MLQKNLGPVFFCLIQRISIWSSVLIFWHFSRCCVFPQPAGLESKADFQTKLHFLTFLFSFFLVLPSLASASTSDPSPEQSPFLRPGVLKKVSLSFTATAAAAARPNCTGDSFSRRMSVYEIILFTIPAVSSLARLITKEVFFSLSNSSRVEKCRWRVECVTEGWVFCGWAGFENVPCHSGHSALDFSSWVFIFAEFLTFLSLRDQFVFGGSVSICFD